MFPVQGSYARYVRYAACLSNRSGNGGHCKFEVATRFRKSPGLRTESLHCQAAPAFFPTDQAYGQASGGTKHQSRLGSCRIHSSDISAPADLAGHAVRWRWHRPARGRYSAAPDRRAAVGFWIGFIQPFDQCHALRAITPVSFKHRDRSKGVAAGEGFTLLFRRLQIDRDIFIFQPLQLQRDAQAIAG